MNGEVKKVKREKGEKLTTRAFSLAANSIYGNAKSSPLAGEGRVGGVSAANAVDPDVGLSRQTTHPPRCTPTLPSPVKGEDFTESQFALCGTEGVQHG